MNTGERPMKTDGRRSQKVRADTGDGEKGFERALLHERARPLVGSSLIPIAGFKRDGR